ncbi:MAG: PKD domain-containing protein, partial [Bacteroidales bacterium]|nr:PKD domain-containing protein [Bacteroidales bacterium]
MNVIGDNQMRVNWTRGNGNAVIVLAKKSSPVDVSPINGVNYTANANFGAGEDIYDENYVVYKGTGTNVMVNDLSPGTNYYFAVYEYFTANNCYKIPGLSGSASTTGQIANFCDSISQFCCTPTLYTTGEDDSYVSGTNEYNFSAFAEKFEDTEPFNQLEGFRIYFGVVQNTTNPNISFVAWDNQNGIPTNELATKTVPLSTIESAVNAQGFYDVYFDDMVSIPSNGFFVGLLEPGASGNIIAIVTNQQGEGENTGYTKYGSWYDYESLFGVSFQHLILPFVCYDNALPPVANFSGTPTRVAIGETVQFTDLTSGSIPNSWAWTFEGGTPPNSGIANPNITYNELGFYDVNLTVSNDNGSNSISKTNYIEVFDPNNVSAFSLDFEACSDFQVDNFAPWTTIDVDAKPTYTAGGFTFPNEGYTGSFIAFNSNNTSPTATGWEAHGGNLCGACFAATTPPNNDWLVSSQIQLGDNSSFSFWAKSITDDYGLERFVVHVSTTGNQPANFTKISTGTYVQAPTTWTKYTYNLSAYDNQTVYVAVQCVSNDAFAFMIDDIEIYSEYSAPTCDFQADQTTVQYGSTVNFTDLSTQMPTSWQWSFPGGTPSSSTVQNPSITYNDLGTYDVSLTVTNAEGSDSKVKTGYIVVTEAPEVIVLWDFPNNPDNNIADGGITANLTKTITPFGGVNDILYTAAGVTTRCIDGETWASGANSKGWSVNFTTIGYEGLKLSFAQRSNNAQSPRDFKVQYSLNGSTWTDLGLSYQLATNVWTEKNEISLPAACNNQANVYIRWLMTSNTGCGGGTVSNNGTTRRNAMDNIKVTGFPMAAPPPETDFSASAISICVDETINFTDLSTNEPDTWSWTFDGGTPSTSNVKNPSVTYSTAGTYTVSLTASNTSGSDTKTKTAYITVNPNPSANASNAGPYCVGQTIQLNAIASGSNTYAWSGPASYTSTQQNPTRVNASTNHAGTYTVTVTNNSTGCSTTETTDVVVNSNPTVSVSNNGPACAGGSINLNATGNGGTSYSWTGPDAFSSTSQNPSITNIQTNNSGTYTVTYTNNSTGCSATANTIVVVNASPSLTPSNDGPHCVGQTINLSANGSGGTSYSWSGPNSFTSTSANPSITNAQTTHAGSYSVTITNTSTGCSTSGTTNVIVNNNPNITASNNGALCVGQNLNLTANGSGGTAYSWTGPVSFSSTNQNPNRNNVTTAHAGTYTVTLTNTATGCSASATTNVIVNANPTISASNNGPICEGNNLNLNAIGNGGTSYEWTGPASFSSTNQDPSISNAITTHSGTYTVTLTNTYTGCTASASTNAVVNANPTLNASNNGPLCEGATINLNAIGSGGTAYSWTGPASFSSTNQNPNRTNAITAYAGNYTVSLTNTTTGCSATANTNLIVNANPSISASNNGPICAGETLSLTANGSGGNQYSWSGPAGFTSTIQNPNRTNALATYSGNYTVTITNTNTGCSANATTNAIVNATPTVNLGADINSCPEDQIVLDAGSGYIYQWSTGATSQTITPTTSGLYSVTIINSNSCSASDEINVNFYTPAVLTMSSTSETGTNHNNGTASVVASGTSPFTYAWNTGQTTATITGLTGGNYTV